MRAIPFSLGRCASIVFLVTLEAMSTASRAACYSTPKAAIDAFVATPSSSSASENNGYRVTRIELDKVLARRWAMIARCGHPEWPAIAFPANGVDLLASPQAAERSLGDSARMAPIVRAGDVVRLWKQESSLRIELAGVSEESGGLGKTIRVRLVQRNTYEQSVPEQFSGIIRGPLDVEMQSNEHKTNGFAVR
jgi:hypothetical protein